MCPLETSCLTLRGQTYKKGGTWLLLCRFYVRKRGDTGLDSQVAGLYSMDLGMHTQ
ncbi:mCG1041341 [Mus musculus]|nr:mCG1041341 [Mus musculus]